MKLTCASIVGQFIVSAALLGALCGCVCLLVAIMTWPADADEIVPRRKRVLFFKSQSCGPCRTAMREIDPWMRASGWTLGPTADCHVQYCDSETDPALASRFNVETLPTFVLIEDAKETGRKVGYELTKPEETRRTVIVDLYNGGAKQ